VVDNVRLCQTELEDLVTIMIYNAHHTLYPALYPKSWPWRHSIISYKASFGEIWVYLGLERCDVELEKIDGIVAVGILIRAIHDNQVG
jgi:hypothetical protein